MSRPLILCFVCLAFTAGRQKGLPREWVGKQSRQKQRSRDFVHMTRSDARQAAYSITSHSAGSRAGTKTKYAEHSMLTQYWVWLSAFGWCVSEVPRPRETQSERTAPKRNMIRIQTINLIWVRNNEKNCLCLELSTWRSVRWVRKLCAVH